MIGLLYAFIVWLSSQVQEKKGEFPIYFYVLILGSYAIHQVNIYTVFLLNIRNKIMESHQ
jgi:PAT family acetyl-CoA transporter-like MFS transporter 1